MHGETLKIRFNVQKFYVLNIIFGSVVYGTQIKQTSLRCALWTEESYNRDGVYCAVRAECFKHNSG